MNWFLNMLERICVLFVILSISDGITGSNLALHKPTAMTSQLNEWGSDYAVDGNTTTALHNPGCAHTNYDDTQQWWVIDLQGTYNINTVTVTNRGERSERLHDFVIEVLDQNPVRCPEAVAKTCFFTKSALGEGETRAINCNGITRGRFVRIRKTSRKDDQDVLTLCEVQVFGDRKADCEFPSFPRILNKRLVSGDMETKMGTTPVECASVCARKIHCLAFNFNANTKVCELVLNPKFTDTIEKNPDWSYYGSDLC